MTFLNQTNFKTDLGVDFGLEKDKQQEKNV